MTTNAFDAANRVTSVTGGDSSVVYYSYDNANRVTEVKHKTSGGTVLSDYQYGYDAVNCTSQTDSDSTVVDYGYDDADQLTSEVRDNSHSTGYTIGYTYDHNQNRLTKVLNSVTDTYSYDNQNKLTGVSGSVSKSYYYDSNGNCTSVVSGSNTTSLSYDYENRVSGITFPSSATNSFSYNGNDLRIKKVDSSGTRNYITDGDSPAAPVLSDGLATFTPGLSERRSSTSAFYHGDALGSTRDITNSSQTVTDTRRTDGFGMSLASTGSNPTPFGFGGAEQYQSDADSGLMLLGERYYDASIGRFISQDPIQAGTNWYAYCGNNPITRVDSSGEFWWLIILLVVALMADSETHAGEAGPNPSNPYPGHLPPLTQNVLGTALIGPFVPALLPAVGAEVGIGVTVGVGVGADIGAIEGGVSEGGSVYRAGPPSDGNLTARPQDGGMLSGRDSLSNPITPGTPGPQGGRPVFAPGDPYTVIDPG